MDLSNGSIVKNSSANSEDMDLIPGAGSFHGEGNGYPLQYSPLGNPTDRGDLRATVHGVTGGSDTTEQLNTCHLGSYGSSMPLSIK